jgi:hypothetical protein
MKDKNYLYLNPWTISATDFLDSFNYLESFRCEECKEEAKTATSTPENLLIINQQMEKILKNAGFLRHLLSQNVSNCFISKLLCPDVSC